MHSILAWRVRGAAVRHSASRHAPPAAVASVAGSFAAVSILLGTNLVARRAPSGGDRYLARRSASTKIGLPAQLRTLPGLDAHAAHGGRDGKGQRALCGCPRQLLGACGEHRSDERTTATGVVRAFDSWVFTEYVVGLVVWFVTCMFGYLWMMQLCCVCQPSFGCTWSDDVPYMCLKLSACIQA